MSAQPEGTEYERAEITSITFVTPEPTVAQRLLAACDTDAVPVKTYRQRIIDGSKPSPRAIDAMREFPSI